METDGQPRSRRYGGLVHAERKAGRRDRLIEAAVIVYGDHGFRQSSIQKVCTAANLTKRYFYESFENSEALLVAAFDSVAETLFGELEIAAAACPEPRPRAHAILITLFTALQHDQKRARLFLMEASRLGADFEQAMRRAQDRIGQLIAPARAAYAGDEAGTAELSRLGAVAGMLQITIAWIASDYRYRLDDVIAASLLLFAPLLADARTVAV